MNKLIKPRKQSYTGEDARVVAYADPCELAWVAGIGIGGLGTAGVVMAVYGIAIPPVFVGVTAFLLVGITSFSSAACYGLHLIPSPYKPAEHSLIDQTR